MSFFLRVSDLCFLLFEEEVLVSYLQEQQESCNHPTKAQRQIRQYGIRLSKLLPRLTVQM